MMGKVILLTGAPATGKSSLATSLQEKINSSIENAEKLLRSQP